MCHQDKRIIMTITIRAIPTPKTKRAKAKRDTLLQFWENLNRGKLPDTKRTKH